MSKSITAQSLAKYLNEYLDPFKIEEKAYNGIQVTNTGTITSLATAVSASMQAIMQAAELNVQALVTHHGIFCKGDSHPLVGITYEKVKVLLSNNIALLTYHLPLDAHQVVGNNWKAAQDLGLKNLEPIIEYSKVPIGVMGTITKTPFDTFKTQVETYYGRPAQFVAVKDSIEKVVITSGGADRFVRQAAQAGADCFITGRVDEPVWDDAHESGISFLGLGHYGTETVGPKALAEHLSKQFGIPCTFIKTDNPF